jgi:CRISPR/Cas system-associated exonuclease Cas4 (RecB family)
MTFLSKSDFKIAHICPTKLWYKKHGYPTSNDENEYMKMLADGGFMFGKLAMLLFPEGIEVTETIPEAIVTTEELLLNNENIVLFEPAISVNNQLVRVDILQKIGNEIKIIEVKSKSFDSTKMNEKNYWFKPDMKPYIEDIAFQTKVVSEKYKTAVVNSFLMMPDTAAVSQFDDLINKFQIVNIPPLPNSKYRNVDVAYTGDEMLIKKINEAYLNQTFFVKLIPVNDQIKMVMNEVIHSSNQFIK